MPTHKEYLHTITSTSSIDSPDMRAAIADVLAATWKTGPGVHAFMEACGVPLVIAQALYTNLHAANEKDTAKEFRKVLRDAMLQVFDQHMNAVEFANNEAAAREAGKTPCLPESPQ